MENHKYSLIATVTETISLHNQALRLYILDNPKLGSILEKMVPEIMYSLFRIPYQQQTKTLYAKHIYVPKISYATSMHLFFIIPF